MNQNAARKKARLDHQGAAASFNTRSIDAYETDHSTIKRVLARIEELEGKCAHLETKCRSLENTLQQQQQHNSPSFAESIVSSILSHIDSKFLDMESSIREKMQDLDHSSRWLESLYKNRKWKYAAPTIPISYWVSRGFDEEYVDSVDSFLEDIETATCAMRGGECADSYVHLGFGERFDEIDNAYLVYDEVMQSHWTEFVDALGQYHWFLNRSSTGHDDSTFILSDVQIPSEMCYLLEKVLPLNHFKRLTFQNNHFGRFGISLVIKCIEENTKLVEFILSENAIDSFEDAQSLCQAVNNHPALEIFSLKETGQAFSFDIVRSIMHDNCKLECIDLPGNGIRTNGSTHIADFVAKNPPLLELTLENNHLNDDDAEAIAEALKSNTNLKTLILRGNEITRRGEDALKKVIADPSNLNSMAACNHVCQIYLTDNLECATINESSCSKVNRGDKLYRALNSQNSNANSFGSNVNLPTALESIQKYAKYSQQKGKSSVFQQRDDHLPALSIIYEIIRNKAPELYNPNKKLTTFDMEVDILPCVSNE